MKVDLYNQQAKKQKSQITVSDAIFGAEVNSKLLAQYVHVYLSNQREAVAHTKNRGEVAGGGRKPFAQKGTGNARAGSIRSPLWKGGGVTFGPRSERNWKKSINKKMRSAAMRSAFAQALKADTLKFVDDIKFESTRLTSQAADTLKAFENPRKVLIITDGVRQDLINAFANIKNARVLQVQELSAYDLLTAGTVLMLESSLGFAKVWAGNEENEEGNMEADTEEKPVKKSKVSKS